MIPTGYEKAEPGAMPKGKAVAAMVTHNESLKQVGVLLARDGLHPPSMGARLVIRRETEGDHGPLLDAKGALGGYWMVQVKWKAVEWASRFPPSADEASEVRQVPEASDLPADVKKAAAKLPERQAQAERRKRS
jgi:hypothetical protein